MWMRIDMVTSSPLSIVCHNLKLQKNSSFSEVRGEEDRYHVLNILAYVGGICSPSNEQETIGSVAFSESFVASSIQQSGMYN